MKGATAFFLPWLPCRGCLGPIEAGSEAGLCGECWKGLWPLPEPRCLICALPHPEEDLCRKQEPWIRGDALWDYHGGRPALGSLLVPAIKKGEMGWKKALLRHLNQALLPPWTQDIQAVVPAPTVAWRRWFRGQDLAQDTAALLAQRLGQPMLDLLWKSWWAPRQSGRNRTERRTLRLRDFHVRSSSRIHALNLLLVDDVWTTGSTLRACARALLEDGAASVSVLCLFRALEP